MKRLYRTSLPADFAYSVCSFLLFFVCEMFRALPMSAFLIGWPIFSVYFLIPRYRDRPWIDTLTVGSFLVLMLVLQILGTIRSARSFLEKMKAAHADKVDEWNTRMAVKGGQLIAPPPRPKKVDDDDDEPTRQELGLVTPLPAPFFSDTFQSASAFRWTNVHNLVALLTLLIEAAQLIMFAVQTLDADTAHANTGADTPSIDSTDESRGGGGIFGPALMPVLFINIAAYLSNHIGYVYAYVSVAVVGLLLIVFLAQFFKELLGFATASSQQVANDIFFHSFIGSIVYGHGLVKNVSSFVSNIVALLSDTLFLIICSKLMAVFTCINPTDSQPALLLIDPTMVCWEGDHQCQTNHIM
jgi:hypothetical protein